MIPTRSSAMRLEQTLAYFPNSALRKRAVNDLPVVVLIPQTPEPSQLLHVGGPVAFA